jgi:hypothetical protein
MVHVQRLAVFGLAAMAMFSAWVANAQCYQFNGTPSSVILNFKNLPPPRVIPGTHNYSWSDRDLHAGPPVVSLIVAGKSYASELYTLGFGETGGITMLTAVLSVANPNSGTDGGTANGPVRLILKLRGSGNLLPNGLLPATFPPISAWTIAGIGGSVALGINSATNFTSITSCPG